MSVLILSLLAGIAPPPSPAVEVSPAVRAVGAKYGRAWGLQAEAELATLAGKGDRTAAALLGELLRMPGRTGGQDFARACDYSEKAGKHDSALHNSATCYFAGQGRPRDLARARLLYGQAADLGNAKSQCALGNMLIGGDGGPSDVPRGLALCRAAADAGLADAQTDYAGYLLVGKHLPRDAIAARRYLTLAAEQNQANAAFLLAQVYAKGDGVAKSIPTAAIWWIKAYENGRTDAAYWIGNAATGIIVDGAKAKQPVPTVAIEQARKWLGIAADKDPDSAKRKDAAELLGLLEQMLAAK